MHQVRYYCIEEIYIALTLRRMNLNSPNRVFRFTHLFNKYVHTAPFRIIKVAKKFWRFWWRVISCFFWAIGDFSFFSLESPGLNKNIISIFVLIATGSRALSATRDGMRMLRELLHTSLSYSVHLCSVAVNLLKNFVTGTIWAEQAFARRCAHSEFHSKKKSSTPWKSKDWFSECWQWFCLRDEISCPFPSFLSENGKCVRVKTFGNLTVLYRILYRKDSIMYVRVRQLLNLQIPFLVHSRHFILTIGHRMEGKRTEIYLEM